jgi:hypothetical protein
LCQKNIAFTTENFLITENLAVHGKEGERGFFASQVSKCKYKHSPQGNELCGIGRSEPLEPENEAGGEKPQLNAGSFVLQGGGRGQLTKTSQKFTESSI